MLRALVFIVAALTAITLLVTASDSWAAHQASGLDTNRDTVHWQADIGNR
ncbi:MAG: hypothetical protein ACK5JR_11905 [Tropicimonas sp.]